MTSGDRYCLTFFQDEGYTGAYGEQDLERKREIANTSDQQAIKKADSKKVLSLSISIPKEISMAQREEKMEFYKNEISKRYGIPVRFFDSSETEKRIFPKKQVLEERLSSAIALIGLLGSLFFSSMNITGNTISNLSNTTSSWIGIILFLIGTASALLYFSKKKYF